MDRVAIIVPVLKNFRGLTEFVASIETHVPYSIFIIDNYNHPGRCVAASWNEGIRRASNKGIDQYLVSNDDVILEPYFIDKAVHHMEAKGWDRLITGWNTRPSFPTGQAPDYSCFFMNETLYNKVGPFDEKFKPAYFEDNDYEYRVKLAGYESYAVPELRMLHRGSVTQNMDTEKACTSEQFQKNSLYFLAKWGGTPGFETYKEAFNGEI